MKVQYIGKTAETLVPFGWLEPGNEIEVKPEHEKHVLSDNRRAKFKILKGDEPERGKKPEKSKAE